MRFETRFREENFRRDWADHYCGHIETRILVDPYWVQVSDDPIPCSVRLKGLMRYAHRVSIPTKIELVYPRYLEPVKPLRYTGAVLPSDTLWVDAPSSRAEDDSAREVEDVLLDAREAYSQLAADATGQPDAEELQRLVGGQMLFSTDRLHILEEYSHFRCDYLLTDNPWLLERADDLRDTGCWVVTCDELFDCLELSMRAAGVFYRSDPQTLGAGIEGLGVSSFYPMVHKKVMAYWSWWERLRKRHEGPKVYSYGRAAFLHRLPFALYAADLITYHVDYSRRLARANRYRSDHRFYAAYHLNVFYVMISGILDNVAWLLNYVLELGFSELDGSRHQCSLTRRDFRRAVRKKVPQIADLLVEPEVKEWLDKLLYKRHPAVHREPLHLTELVEKETGKVLVDAAHVVEEEDGTVLLDLLNHVPYDRGMLFSFMDRLITMKLDNIELDEG